MWRYASPPLLITEGGIFESALRSPVVLGLLVLEVIACGADGVPGIIREADVTWRDVVVESSGGDPQPNARGPPSDSPWW